MLIAAVRKYGACRWSMIATQLSTGRVGKQCRERWNNHLCPEVKKSEWSEEEDRAIIVELNPLAEFSGMGLFDWLTDSKCIMEEPFELRIVERPPPFSAKDMGEQWSAFVTADL